MSHTEAISPYTLYNVTGRLISQPEVARMISRDQQLFSSFFAMTFKLIMDNANLNQLDSSVRELMRMITNVSSKTFSVNELGVSAKLADSLRGQLGQHVTAEYLGKYLAFCDLFFTVENGISVLRNAVPTAIISIGNLLCQQAVNMRQGKSKYATVIESNIRSVASIYDMSPHENVLLEHAMLMSVDQDAHIFFKLYKQSCEQKGLFRLRMEAALLTLFREDLDGEDNYKAAANAVDRVLSHKTSKPLAFNIVKMGSDASITQLSPFWGRVLTYDHADGAEGFVNLFVKEVKPTKTYSSVIARMNETVIPLFQDLIKSCVERSASFNPAPEFGVNMLF